MQASSGQYRIDGDIGGTFTGLVIYNDATDSVTIGKTLTTPRDPSQAVKRWCRTLDDGPVYWYWKRRTSMSLSVKADVVIIGAGIMGASCAFHLSCH